MTSTPPAPVRTPGRSVGWALLVVAVLLAVWAGWLGHTLDPAAHRSHWVGLDAVEVVGLVATGVFLVTRRRWRAAAAALLSAPLFLYDATLDVVSAHGSTSDLLMALGMAFVAELPMACALACVAWRCAHSTVAPAGTR